MTQKELDYLDKAAIAAMQTFISMEKPTEFSAYHSYECGAATIRRNIVYGSYELAKAMLEKRKAVISDLKANYEGYCLE